MSGARALWGVAALLALSGLSACGGDAPDAAPDAIESEVPEELAGNDTVLAPVGESIGTPMAERVATLGLLNKRNNISQDVELSPGEAFRLDDIVIRLSACEQSAPWELPAETGAFVQVSVEDRPDADSDAEWLRVFSGWLFKNSPGLNVVEHPVYDVWVKECAMSFPGDAPIAAEEPSVPVAPVPAAPAPEAADPETVPEPSIDLDSAISAE